MPIEIRELHIRVAIEPEPGKTPAPGSVAGNQSGAGADKDSIVAECVEQVLQILQSRKER